MLFFTSAVFLVGEHFWRRLNPRLRFLGTVLFLFTPLKVFVDHSDTQINFLPISLFLFSLRAALSFQFTLSALLGVLCVLTKHTFLIAYPSFVIFTLAHTARLPTWKEKCWTLSKVSITALLTAAPVLLPFYLSGSLGDMASRLTREKGIILYYVPSFWQFLNTFKSIRYYHYTSQAGRFLKYSALVLSSVFQVPALVALAKRPTTRQFMRAIHCCALASYLFGYEINEKGIMFALLPLHLSLFDADPSLFFGIFLSSTTALRHRFSQDYLQDKSYVLLLLFFAPIFTLVYFSVESIPAPRAPQSSFSNLRILFKFPLSFLFSLQRLLTVAAIAIVLFSEGLGLAFPPTVAQPYFWVVICFNLLFLLLFATLITLTAEMYARPQSSSVYDKIEW